MQRGCFSYDKTYITDWNDPRYHLVASPLNINRDDNIENKLLFKNLFISSKLNNQDTININNIQ